MPQHIRNSIAKSTMKKNLVPLIAGGGSATWSKIIIQQWLTVLMSEGPIEIVLY